MRASLFIGQSNIYIYKISKFMITSRYGSSDPIRSRNFQHLGPLTCRYAPRASVGRPGSHIDHGKSWEVMGRHGIQDRWSPFFHMFPYFFICFHIFPYFSRPAWSPEVGRLDIPKWSSSHLDHLGYYWMGWPPAMSWPWKCWRKGWKSAAFPVLLKQNNVETIISGDRSDSRILQTFNSTTECFLFIATIC